MQKASHIAPVNTQYVFLFFLRSPALGVESHAPALASAVHLLMTSLSLMKY